MEPTTTTVTAGNPAPTARLETMAVTVDWRTGTATATHYHTDGWGKVHYITKTKTWPERPVGERPDRYQARVAKAMAGYMLRNHVPPFRAWPIVDVRPADDGNPDAYTVTFAIPTGW
jgi:hypothetical protein